MTSYEKRKMEIKELKAETYRLNDEFIDLKHLILAIARGQKNHAEQCLRHFDKKSSMISYSRELDEIRQLIEKI